MTYVPSLQVDPTNDVIEQSQLKEFHFWTQMPPFSHGCKVQPADWNQNKSVSERWL